MNWLPENEKWNADSKTFPDHVKLIQVKSSKYALTAKDKVTLSNMARPNNTRIEIWLYQLRKPFIVEVIG